MVTTAKCLLQLIETNATLYTVNSLRYFIIDSFDELELEQMEKVTEHFLQDKPGKKVCVQKLLPFSILWLHLHCDFTDYFHIEILDN